MGENKCMHNKQIRKLKTEENLIMNYFYIIILAPHPPPGFSHEKKLVEDY